MNPLHALLQLIHGPQPMQQPVSQARPQQNSGLQVRPVQGGNNTTQSPNYDQGVMQLQDNYPQLQNTVDAARFGITGQPQIPGNLSNQGGRGVTSYPLYQPQNKYFSDNGINYLSEPLTPIMPKSNNQYVNSAYSAVPLPQNYPQQFQALPHMDKLQ